MKQVLIRNGHPVVEDVPPPRVEPGTIVVGVAFSCISPGTELSGIQASAQPLWRRALRDPSKVVNVFNLVREKGLPAAVGMVRSQLDRAAPTGYAAAGTVVAVGAGVKDISIGQRVACAGSQYAHHAEVVRVPRNLVVAVPDGLALAHASTVTIGAIALQGVRRFGPTLGETCVVMGLGLIGQITAQILRANGCRVIGLDLDPHRTELAQQLGVNFAMIPDDGREVEQVMRVTDGHGADGVIVAAASESDQLISSAFRMCRRKGRVVLVGDVGLNLRRQDIYERELDFLVSTSYGPGRYDRAYEEEGLEYPIGYVRWTENRNMAAYLELLATGVVRVDRLLPEAFDIGSAADAYRSVNEGSSLGALLRYQSANSTSVSSRVANPTGKKSATGALRLGVIGAGGFARGTHLPLVQSMPALFSISAIASRSGPNAGDIARQTGARFATTDYREILNDPAVDAVLITTRHNLHASIALEALAAGKHVLVEKPLALNREELDSIRAHFEGKQTSPVLLTGYNRRFSPLVAQLRSALAQRSNPLMISYRMNAGRLPSDHWTHGPEGGGRNIGEACHIYDLFTALVGVNVSEVKAMSLIPATEYYRRDDNFVVTLRFADGSVASLVYTAMGSSKYPKERMDVFCDGDVFTLDDYRTMATNRADSWAVKPMPQQKGWHEEWLAFHAAASGRTEWPIPLWEQLQASEIALAVNSQLL